MDHVASVPPSPPMAMSRRVGWIRDAVLILLWTAIVRLPFAHIVNDDEAFFSVIATRWLHGEWPYAASFDVKPPLLFAIVAVAQALFGASLATIKGLEVAFTAAGAILLFRMIERQGSRPTAIWAALLFPVYSLSLLGVTSLNSVLQLPFLIGAFSALATAITAQGRRGGSLFVAGFAIGCAGMTKQTAVFEAVAMAALTLWYCRGDRPIARLAALIAGALLPVCFFALLFAAAGHLPEAIQAVVLSAAGRADLSVPGAKQSAFLTVARIVFLIEPLHVLAVLGVLALLRRHRLSGVFSGPLMAIAGWWWLAALVGVAVMRSLFPYYAATLIAPLLILSGAVVMHGISFSPRWRQLGLSLCAVLAALFPIVIDAHQLYVNDGAGPDDYAAEFASGEKLLELGARPSDSALVVGRGLYAYLVSGTLPNARYFHDLHLLSTFPTPDPEPLAMSLAAQPRFILVANPRYVRTIERRDRIAAVQEAVAKNYRLMAVTRGVWDSTYIYERNRP